MNIVATVTTALQNLLGPSLDQLARACGLVRRQRKFSGQSLLRFSRGRLLDEHGRTLG